MRRAAQSRAASIFEALANVGVGFVVAVLTQHAVFPRFGLIIPARDHLVIGVVFTLVSLLRSYLLRRLFATWGRS
ncbi:MAG: hypothetical protein RLZZ528_3 [Pseudomonadota bacterium]|jgi:hypothetical protein